MTANVDAMAVQRMDHVGIIVSDIAAATEFFVELGLKVVGQAHVEGELAGRVIGLTDVRSEIAMLETPDGHSRVELSQFETPASPDGDPGAASNVLGIRHVTFLVDDVRATFAGLQKRGAQLVGEIVNYNDIYLLCYVRGPDGIIVELSEEIGER